MRSGFAKTVKRPMIWFRRHIFGPGARLINLSQAQTAVPGCFGSFSTCVLNTTEVRHDSLAYWRNYNTSKPANLSAVNTTASEPTLPIAAVDRDAIENHQVCALSYPPGWSFDEQRVAHNLTPRFAPLIHAVDRHPASYELIEGHICTYEQRKYAHLIFRNQDHTVSVFIEPDDPRGNPKSSLPLEVAQTSYKAYQVASVDTGIHRIFVVSDLPSVENRALANQLFSSTIDFILKLEHQG